MGEQGRRHFAHFPYSERISEMVMTLMINMSRENRVVVEKLLLEAFKCLTTSGMFDELGCVMYTCQIQANCIKVKCSLLAGCC